MKPLIKEVKSSPKAVEVSKLKEVSKEKEEKAEVIGSSKEKRAEMRKEIGLTPEPKLSDKEEHKHTTLHDEANRLVESREVVPKDLALKSLEKHKKGKGKYRLTDLDGAILQRGLVDSVLKRKKAQKEFHSAKADADSEKMAIAAEEFNDAIVDTDLLHTALKAEGTASARYLASLRKGINLDYSIEAVYSRFKKRNNGKPLSQDYVQHLTEKVEEIELLKEKVDALEDQIKEIPKEQRKEPTKRAKSKKRLSELKEERTQILSEWKKYRKGDPNPVVQNAMLPIGDKDIKFLSRLALNYAETGVISVNAFSKKLKADVKMNLNMNLTDEDVDAILQTSIDGGSVMTTVEKKRLERLKEVTKKRIEKLNTQIEKGGRDKKEGEDVKLDDEAQLLVNEKEQLQKKLNDIDNWKKYKEKILAAFDYSQLTESKREAEIEAERKKRELNKEEQAFAFLNKNWKEKLKQGYVNLKDKDARKEQFSQIIGIPKSLRSSFDLSAPRQGWYGTIAHPVSGAKAFYQMFAQAFSEDNYQRWIAEYKTSPEWQLAQKSGLLISDESELSQREEDFMSDIAEKIPLGVGKVVRASSRAYSAYLNTLRANIFDDGAKALMKDGRFNYEKDPKVFEQWASFTNDITGRGEIDTEWVKKSAPIVSSVIWSPGLLKSRINLLTLKNIRQLDTPWVLRKKMIKDHIVMFGFIGALLALASASGADVEDDPRSSDFGKIRDGYLRYDMTAGLGAYATLVSRFATSQTKSTKTGKIRTISPWLFPGKDMTDIIQEFGRYKFAPVSSAAFNIMAGADAMGIPTTAAKELTMMFPPLPLVEAYESYERAGVEGIAETVPYTTFGVSVGAYGSPKDDRDRKKAVEKARKEAERYKGNIFSDLIDLMVN